MKIFNYKNILATLFLSIISIVDLLAKRTNPPTPMGAGGFDDTTVVGGPIDNYIPLLIVVAIAFGIYALNKNKKATILQPVKVSE